MTGESEQSGERTEYCIPHLTTPVGSRHKAVGRAAIIGREAPDRMLTVEGATEAVTAVGPNPRNFPKVVRK